MTRHRPRNGDVRAAPADIPRILAVGLPLFVLLVLIAGRLAGVRFYRAYFEPETGFVESATFVFLVIAAISCGRLLWRPAELRSHLLVAWTLLVMVGCVIFAGEEASWGQHYLGFATPEGVFSDIGQRETNLRNFRVLEPLLDTGARDVLELGVLGGGLLMPLGYWLVVARRQRTFASRPSLLWPTARLVPAAFLATAITLPWKVFKVLHQPVPAFLDLPKPGELKECYLALFLLLYVLSLSVRVRALRTVPYRTLRRTRASRSMSGSPAGSRT